MRIWSSGTPSEFFIRLPAELLLSDLEIIEEPPGPDTLTPRWLDYPEILPDPDIIPDTRVLSHPIHSLPMNSLSATRQSIQSFPKRRMNRSIMSLRSSQLELPRLGRSLNINGNAIPLYVIPNMRIFMLTSPNFQLVRSMLRTRPVLTGSREKSCVR